MTKMQKYILDALMIAFLLLFLFWSIGYFCNAIYGMKFDLSSCWGGFQAIGGAGFLAAIKYIMDSWKNSPVGESPFTSSATLQLLGESIAPMPEKVEEEKKHE